MNRMEDRTDNVGHERSDPSDGWVEIYRGANKLGELIKILAFA